MKIKLETLVNSYGALQRLASLYLTGKLNFSNGRTLADAQRYQQRYAATNTAMLKKHGAKPVSETQWQFPDSAARAAYQADMQPVLDEEVEVFGEPYELTLSSFDASLLSGAEMFALRWLVTFVDDEDQAGQGEPAKAKRAKAK